MARVSINAQRPVTTDTLFFKEVKWLGFGKGYAMKDSTGRTWYGAVGIKGSFLVSAYTDTNEIFHYRKVG